MRSVLTATLILLAAGVAARQAAHAQLPAPSTVGAKSKTATVPPWFA
jgi:hypothetical protein